MVALLASDSLRFGRAAPMAASAASSAAPTAAAAEGDEGEVGDDGVGEELVYESVEKDCDAAVASPRE